MSSTVAETLPSIVDSRVQLFSEGGEPVNSSFPVFSERIQQVFPSSGQINRPIDDNVNFEFRQLLDKNSAVDLGRSFILVEFQVLEDPTTSDLTAPNPVTFVISSNTARIFNQAQLYVGSTTVEVVNNVGVITDCKMASMSQESINSHMSDCFLLPTDNSQAGVPPYANCTNDSSAFINELVYGNDNGYYVNAEYPSVPGNTNAGFQDSWTANSPAWMRNQQLVNVDANEDTGFIAKRITRRIPLSYIFGWCENDSAGSFIPSTLVQINLLTGLTRNMMKLVSANSYLNTQRIVIRDMRLMLCYYTLNPESIDLMSGTKVFGVSHYSTLLSSTPTGASNETTGTGTANRPVNATASSSQSVQVQAYAGLLGICIRFVNNQVITAAETGGDIITNRPAYGGFAAWQSAPPCTNITLSLIYRGIQNPLSTAPFETSFSSPPLLLEYMNYGQSAPISAFSGANRNSPPANLDPYLYYESYATQNGSCWDGFAKNEVGGCLYSLNTWAKPQLTWFFPIVEGGQSSDTVAGPIQVNIAYAGTVAAIRNTKQPGDVEVTVIRGDPNPQIAVTIKRTNIVKWLESRSPLLITNGSS